MEIVGKDRVVDVLNMTKLEDLYRNNILYELFERVDPSFGKIHVIRCTSPKKTPDDTPKVDYLFTPPYLSNTWGSVAWTFYERDTTYAPEVET